MPKPYHLRACSPRIEARNKKLAGRANGDGGPCLCLGMKASSASSRPPVRPRVRTLPYRYAVAFSSEPRLLLLLAPPALPRGKPEPGWMRHPPTDTAARPRSARAPPPLLVAAVARAGGVGRPEGESCREPGTRTGRRPEARIGKPWGRGEAGRASALSPRSCCGGRRRRPVVCALGLAGCPQTSSFLFCDCCPVSTNVKWIRKRGFRPRLWRRLIPSRRPVPVTAH